MNFKDAMANRTLIGLLAPFIAEGVIKKFCNRGLVYYTEPGFQPSGMSAQWTLPLALVIYRIRFSLKTSL